MASNSIALKKLWKTEIIGSTKHGCQMNQFLLVAGSSLEEVHVKFFLNLGAHWLILTPENDNSSHFHTKKFEKYVTHCTYRIESQIFTPRKWWLLLNGMLYDQSNSIFENVRLFPI